MGISLDLVARTLRLRTRGSH